MAKKWIQKTHMKKGALSRQLGIAEEDDIPLHVLIRIKEAKIGETVYYDYGPATKHIKVTRLLKRRANLALNLKRINR